MQREAPCEAPCEAQYEIQYEIHLPPDEIGYGVGEEDAQRDTGTRYSDLDPPRRARLALLKVFKDVAFCCVAEDIIPGEERRGKERKGEERRGGLMSCATLQTHNTP